MVANAACAPERMSQGPRSNPRLVVDVSGHPGEPRHLFHRLREPGPLAPWAAQAEGGHPHHGQLRVHLVHDVPREPEVVEHPGGEVLDQHVGPREQCAQHGEPGLLLQVEGQASLVGVDGHELRAALPPVGETIGVRPSGRPHAVNPCDRLKVHHVGAQDAEELCAERSGEPRGHVEHTDPVQGQGEGAGPPEWGCRPSERSGVLAGTGHGAGRRRIDAANAIGTPRLEESPGGIGDEDASLHELREAGHRGGVAHWRHRYAQPGGALDDLVGPMARGPFLDDRRPLFEVGPSGPRGGEALVVNEVDPVDQGHEVLVLLS